MEVIAVKKRLLACLLTVAMLVSFIPRPALAADAGDVTYRDYDENSQTWNETATRAAGTYTLVIEIAVATQLGETMDMTAGMC